MWLGLKHSKDFPLNATDYRENYCSSSLTIKEESSGMSEYFNSTAVFASHLITSEDTI